MDSYELEHWPIWPQMEMAVRLQQTRAALQILWHCVLLGVPQWGLSVHFKAPVISMASKGNTLPSTEDDCCSKESPFLQFVTARFDISELDC